MICNAVGESVHTLSRSCKLAVFIKRNIFIPKQSRSCNAHLEEDFQKRPCFRPYKINREDFQAFIAGLRSQALNQDRFCGPSNLSDEEFEPLAPVSKAQYEELFTYCDPVPRSDGEGLRYVSKKDLLLFLRKLRHSLSDDFL